MSRSRPTIKIYLCFGKCQKHELNKENCLATTLGEIIHSCLEIPLATKLLLRPSVGILESLLLLLFPLLNTEIDILVISYRYHGFLPTISFLQSILIILE